MDDDKAEYDMIDLLAYECNILNESLSDKSLTADEQNEIITNYLKRADSQHEPINDFKDGLYLSLFRHFLNSHSTFI